MFIIKSINDNLQNIVNNNESKIAYPKETLFFAPSNIFCQIITFKIGKNKYLIILIGNWFVNSKIKIIRLK